MGFFFFFFPGVPGERWRKRRSGGRGVRAKAHHVVDTFCAGSNGDVCVRACARVSICKRECVRERFLARCVRKAV